MTTFLLDTHAWVWSLTGSARLSSAALEAIKAAETVLVSPITFFEIAQKVRVDKWAAMEPYVDRLPALLLNQGGRTAVFSPAIAIRAGMMDWAHRDPFDRLLAATALQLSVSLVSADIVFDGIAPRVW